MIKSFRDFINEGEIEKDSLTESDVNNDIQKLIQHYEELIRYEKDNTMRKFEYMSNSIGSYSAIFDFASECSSAIISNYILGQLKSYKVKKNETKEKVIKTILAKGKTELQKIVKDIDIKKSILGRVS